MPDRSLSVLQRVKPADLSLEPFPHIVVPNALPQSLCDDLVDAYPPPSVMAVDTRADNVRWSYGASRIRKNPDIPDIWKLFISYHVSHVFWDEVRAVFQRSIRDLYPRPYPTAEALATLRTGVRGIDRHPRSDLLLDAQIAGNTPPRRPGSVRRVHVDFPNKLFAGLFYLRPDHDGSLGGDLTLNRLRDRYRARSDLRSLFRGKTMPDRYVETVRTVRYEKNTLVMFVNGLTALHGVTVRQPTPHPRLFVNLLGEVGANLFEPPPPHRTAWHRLRDLAARVGLGAGKDGPRIARSR